MIRYGELDQAISIYTRTDDAHENIPVEYYRQVMKLAIALNNDGKHWDMQQSAAILLFLAFSDGHLQPNQLSSSGLMALDHAENLMLDYDLKTDKANNVSNILLKAVGYK